MDAKTSMTKISESLYLLGLPLPGLRGLPRFSASNSKTSSRKIVMIFNAIWYDMFATSFSWVLFWRTPSYQKAGGIFYATVKDQYLCDTVK